MKKIDLSNDNIIHIKKEQIEYLQFRRLLEYNNLVNCYTLSVNNIDFLEKDSDQKSKNIENSYDKICTALQIEKQNIVRPKQSHTDCIKNVENSMVKCTNPEVYYDVDGLITKEKNIDLMLTFADCTPILLYDNIKKAIGNIHSGWRGTVQKIAKKAVENMIQEYNSNPKDIIACIGPCIGKCHFEVSGDVKDIFEKTFGYLGRNCDIIEQSNTNSEKYYIDTTLINRLMLQEIGIKPENIIESGICTVCNSEIMHSYRANGKKAGRNVAILGMK